jgi:hypothetical protein
VYFPFDFPSEKTSRTGKQLVTIRAQSPMSEPTISSRLQAMLGFSNGTAIAYEA